MKKALSEARVIESESKAVRWTVKKGVLNIQPLLVSFVETYLEQSIPYATVFDSHPSKQKIKFERLVEVVSIKTKRVKQMATGPRKK